LGHWGMVAWWHGGSGAMVPWGHGARLPVGGELYGLATELLVVLVQVHQHHRHLLRVRG
jgi:hypothetical protein